MESLLIETIKKSFENAENAVSKITQDIINMEGMSGTLTRHFYNNIFSMEGAKYLEIGCWKGSTSCSAMCGNKGTIVCIDNWCDFGGPKQEFLTNFEKFKGENNATFIEQDCFKVDISDLPKFNIYMYDGFHDHDSHYRALNHYYNCLDDVFIFIVDDWNWTQVRDATKKSIHDLKLQVLYEKEIRLTWDNTHTPHDIGSKSWWNGIYIVVLKKSSYIKMFSHQNYKSLNASLNFNRIWFKGENINPVLSEFVNKDDIHFLEIGSFEGFSANYFTRNFLTGKNCSLTCIDPWIKYSEATVNKIVGWDDVINHETYNLFLKNINEIKDKIIIQRGLSKDILPTLEQKYHFIFIDGDHSADAVYLDGALSFDKVVVGGYILFDDYNWEGGNEVIQKFLKEYEKYIKIVCINTQVMVQKIANKE